MTSLSIWCCTTKHEDAGSIPSHGVPISMAAKCNKTHVFRYTLNDPSHSLLDYYRGGYAPARSPPPRGTSLTHRDCGTYTHRDSYTGASPILGREGYKARHCTHVPMGQPNRALLQQSCLRETNHELRH